MCNTVCGWCTISWIYHECRRRATTDEQLSAASSTDVVVYGPVSTAYEPQTTSTLPDGVLRMPGVAKAVGVAHVASGAMKISLFMLNVLWDHGLVVC